jgi:Acetyl-CoA hydrolase/transferase C-terminal domain
MLSLAPSLSTGAKSYGFLLICLRELLSRSGVIGSEDCGESRSSLIALVPVHFRCGSVASYCSRARRVRLYSETHRSQTRQTGQQAMYDFLNDNPRQTGGRLTINRIDTHWVVTDCGGANLKGLSSTERAHALIRSRSLEFPRRIAGSCKEPASGFEERSRWPAPLPTGW